VPFGTIDAMTEHPEADPGAERRQAPTQELPWGADAGPVEAGGSGDTAAHNAPGRPAPTPSVRRGPGWGALVAVALLSALGAGLLGGLTGGIAGGWLGSTGRLDGLRPDRSPALPSAPPGSPSRPSGSVASIAAKALPSVVTIRVDGADGKGTGSGFVVDRKGHIVTNNHVVADAADGGTITVLLADGAQATAKIVGRDASYDLAVLRVSRTGLAPLTLGSSSAVVVGDPVVAVGAPLGLDSTVTSGIVSALNRPVSPGGSGGQSYINAIQTDAAINPGNSGGPLLDMKGRVIGVNTAIATVPGGADLQAGSIGLGFSIPSDQVRTTVEQLIATGKAQHPIIGVVLDNRYDGVGAKVMAEPVDGRPPVTKGGPADRAGVRAGDIIIEFEGRKVGNGEDLVVAIRARSVGDTVSMKVRRGDRVLDVRMTLQGSSE
jgi:putative serine protease PepD